MFLVHDIYEYEVAFTSNSCNNVSITDIISYMWPIRRLHWASRQEVQATKLLVINMASCVAHWVTFLWRARLHCHRARVDFCLIRTALMNWRVDRQCRVVPPPGLDPASCCWSCCLYYKRQKLRGWPGNETTEGMAWEWDYRPRIMSVFFSLVPRPSHRLVFDRLQYAKMEGEGLGTRIQIPYQDYRYVLLSYYFYCMVQ